MPPAPAAEQLPMPVAAVRPLIDRENKKFLGVGAFSVDGPSRREVFVDVPQDLGARPDADASPRRERVGNYNALSR